MTQTLEFIANERRPKISLEEQVQHMKLRGIQFNIVSEEQAVTFLKESNYYFKLKAYEKNYPLSSRKKYCNLEFAYLQELSTIDMLLRKAILSLSLDVEHFLKVKLLVDIAEDENEDGYNIIQQFKSISPQTFDNLRTKDGKIPDSYGKPIIEKYGDDFAVWNLVEIISFGELISLCKLYYGDTNKALTGCLNIVRFLRNAAAHNNCLINNLSDNTVFSFKQNRDVNNIISGISEISDNIRKKRMKNRTIHDFVVLMYVFNLLASKSARKNQFMSLQDLFKGRIIKNKNYFSSNQLLISNYNYLSKIIDFFSKSVDF